MRILVSSVGSSSYHESLKQALDMIAVTDKYQYSLRVRRREFLLVSSEYLFKSWKQIAQNLVGLRTPSGVPLVYDHTLDNMSCDRPYLSPLSNTLNGWRKA